MDIAVVAAVGLSAAALLRPGWRLAQAWVTLAHELGHSVAALIVEGRVRRIRIGFDAGGDTEWTDGGRGHRLSRAFVTWSGYPAPGLFAIMVALGVHLGQARAALAGVAVLVAVVTGAWVRTVWGGVACLALVAGCGAAAVVGGTPAVAVGGALVATWAIGGVRSALHVAGRARAGDGSDPAGMAEVLWLPVAFWSATMVVAAVAAAAGSAVLVAPLVLR